MSLPEKAIEEFQEIYKEKFGKEISHKDASENAEKLVNFFKILWECDKKDKRKQYRLRTEPDGFPVDGTYSCIVCGTSINETTGWYDQHGQNCLNCRRAIKEKVIPTFVCKNDDSFYKIWQLKSHFNIHPQTARKLIRQGVLKARVILNDKGQPHEYILLKKENPQLIDPDRQSPALKSYHRNRDKVFKKLIKEDKQKFRAEQEKLRIKKNSKNF
jgi:hypothetical protein